MTVTSLPPRSRPRRQYISKEAPPAPERAAAAVPQLPGQGKRLNAVRKRRRKRAVLRPMPEKA